MNGVIHLGPNPFRSPRPEPRPEPKGKATLDQAWKSVADLDAAVAVLPEVYKAVVLKGHERGDITSLSSLDVNRTADMDKGTLRAMLAVSLAGYLDNRLMLPEQFVERLRRKEKPEDLKKEIADQMDESYRFRRPPYTDSGYFSARMNEVRAEFEKTKEHIDGHMNDLYARLEQTRGLYNKRHMPPYERELLRKYQALEKFLGTEHGHGHLAHLSEKRRDLSDQFESSRKARNDALAIELTLEINAKRLSPEDMADVWVKSLEYLGSNIFKRSRWLNRLGRYAEAAQCEKEEIAVRNLFFDATLEWLGRQPQVENKKTGKKAHLLAQRLGEVYGILRTTPDMSDESLKVNLQHAQIILRRLVELAKK